MMRSAVSLPPSSVATALVTIVSGIVAVSAPEASAIARSNPATFWKRLTTRSTNSGRSQKVSVRTTRSRFKRRRCGSRSSSPVKASARECAFVLAEDVEAVDDVDAQGKDGERPPRVLAANREHSGNRAEPCADVADDPAEGLAPEQRETSGELDHADDDQHPAKGVEVRKDVPLVVGED